MPTTVNTMEHLVAGMAETLIGSEIIKQANDVNEKIKKGEKIFNLTIGDFDPEVFPIPTALLDEIINAYYNGHTNYPDRKSTRLNSSHSQISYAVFCLKKKNKKKNNIKTKKKYLQ